MREYLQKHLKDRYSDEIIQDMAVKNLEVNVTIPCVGGATPSDVIVLIDLALDKTTVFRKRKTQGKYEKVNTGCLFSKSKEYRVKVYDKSEEQRQKGNPLVEENLLRVEIVFIDRALRRIFGDKWNQSILIDLNVCISATHPNIILGKRLLHKAFQFIHKIPPKINYLLYQPKAQPLIWWHPGRWGIGWAG